jgi:hypothetical protein
MMWMPIQQAIDRTQSIMLCVRPGWRRGDAAGRAGLASIAPLMMIREVTMLLSNLAGAFGWLTLLLGCCGPSCKTHSCAWCGAGLRVPLAGLSGRALRKFLSGVEPFEALALGAPVRCWVSWR